MMLRWSSIMVEDVEPKIDATQRKDHQRDEP